MSVRLYADLPLQAGLETDLPEAAARHVQVRRLQPGERVWLFNGQGGAWQAQVLQMGRSQVRVRVETFDATERELAVPVTVALGMPANERMDWLVEKATELGAASLTPVLMARSSLRLAGERAAKKRAHWQAVAIAACEQSGRNRLLDVREQLTFQEYLGQAPDGVRWLLSLDPAAPAVGERVAAQAMARPVALLSGPEGGLDPTEEAAARQAGFAPLSLGPRVLRAETAPLAALARLLA